ncbi:MAG TPA: hypothetical protein VFP63_02145 [Dehalococcoidia bacterium]|nr:hypothetical protein [Dehalococcoidia bacterium]
MRSFAVAYMAVLALLTALGVLGAYRLYESFGPDDAAEAAADDHAYDFLSWEVEHFPRKWIYKVRHIFDGRTAAEEESALQKYFNAEGEAADNEADVEEIIEGRITAILEDQGLEMDLPLFSDLGLVFPPVDFELDAPPRVLAVSPRDRIELEHSLLLEPGLGREQFEAIEREAESENGPETGVSAVVVGTGGVATYPAVVSSSHPYERVVDTAFHEWVHQYLAFYPLGRNYFAGSDLRTLNETAANLAGEALAAEYFRRYPRLETEATPPPSTAPADPAEPVFDFTKEMRELRGAVEEMLAGGRIREAEALMDAKRQELGQHGYNIRPLNQAYFAFHGSYADTPGSIDPIGPLMQTLLERAGSAGAFVRLAAGITSRSDLDRVLAQAE